MAGLLTVGRGISQKRGSHDVSFMPGIYSLNGMSA